MLSIFSRSICVSMVGAYALLERFSMGQNIAAGTSAGGGAYFANTYHGQQAQRKYTHLHL